jgi:hypothetical protein
MKPINSMIAACIIIGLVYLAVQVEFLQYYQAYKKPFGRVDVDNYLDTIHDHQDKGQDSKTRHILIYALGKASSFFFTPELGFSFLIPLVTCVILTGTVYIFLLYFTRDPELSLLGLIFYIFGTYSMQAFLISAYWAQLFATIGLFVFIILFEEYMAKKSNTVLVLCALCAIFMLVAHLKFIGAIPLYIFARATVNKSFKVSIGIMGMLLIGWLLFPNILTSVYPVPMGIDYVLTKFLMPMFWLIAIAYMYDFKSTSVIDRTFFLFACLVFIISSFSALWRPLVSALPIFIYLVVKYIGDLRINRKLYYAMVLLIVACMGVYFFFTTSYAISSMLGEMIPGVFPFTYRDMDPNPFLHMFSGNGADLSKFNETGQNITVHRVTGFVSSLTGKATETDVVLYGN